MSTKNVKFRYRIGVGCGDLKLGKTEEEISRFLGDKGTSCSVYDDVYFVDYKKFGININYSQENKRANGMFFYRNQEGFESFDGETLEGIGWHSTMREVFETYGKPMIHFTDQIFNRMVYEGSSFTFVHKKMERMSVTWEYLDDYIEDNGIYINEFLDDSYVF